jgi:glycosyltransferase involved in cell wall biosynthesis
MNKLSAVIITKNEESNIERCLKSLLWADEIIILDTGSTDKTIEIADTFGAKIHHLAKWEGFGPAKNQAVSLASNDWIISVDTDEEVTPDLKTSILKILDNPFHDIYAIKRKSFYLGKLINHSGWNRDYPKRLFNRKKAQFNSKSVHESVVGSSNTGKIEAHLLHYTYPTVSSHLNKINHYTELSKNKNLRSGITISLLRGFFKFIKMYILQFGFLDGKTGLILSIISSFGVFIKYLKIWEKELV